MNMNILVHSSWGRKVQNQGADLYYMLSSCIITLQKNKESERKEEGLNTSCYEEYNSHQAHLSVTPH
jgi:hypothetical protein